MARTKRTYNLAASTVSRVREIAEEYGAAPTQDGVVDLAVERLYIELRDAREAAAWASAREDPELRAETPEIARAFADAETWPA
jgi:hypothetical protein